MANNTMLRARPRKSENFNNAGAFALGLLQLLAAAATIGLGVASYVISGSLIYYGVPIWSGSLFFLTAITAFISVRKTICGITTFLITCMLTTAAAATLLIIYARLLSLQGRYTYCSLRDTRTRHCAEYTTRTNLLIIEACTLGVFAIHFTAGAVGMGLCLCGLIRKTLGRTSSVPPPQPRVAVNPHVPTSTVSDAAILQMQTQRFTHEIAIPTAPPEYVVAEEQFTGTHNI